MFLNIEEIVIGYFDFCYTIIVVSMASGEISNNKDTVDPCL